MSMHRDQVNPDDRIGVDPTLSERRNVHLWGRLDGDDFDLYIARHDAFDMAMQLLKLCERPTD